MRGGLLIREVRGISSKRGFANLKRCCKMSSVWESNWERLRECLRVGKGK